MTKDIIEFRNDLSEGSVIPPKYESKDLTGGNIEPPKV